MTIPHEKFIGMKQTYLPANPNDVIGKLLLQAGKIKQSDVPKVLALQTDESLRFGEAAMRLGLVTEEDISRALATQFDYTYLLPGEGGFSDELVTAYFPYTQPAEKLRILRNQLISRWFGCGQKNLSVLGASGRVGTSYVAANLAVSFSQLGQRTLLVDANMHAPRQHKIFCLENHVGLSNVLAGRADLSAIVPVEALVGLSILPSGTLVPNPAEIIGRSSTRLLIEQIGGNFDVVLFDTPPFNEYAEAASLAVMTGGSLLVASRHKTRYEDVKYIRDSLHGTGAQIVGSLLNRD